MCTGRKEEHVPSGIFVNDARPPGFQAGVFRSRCQPGGGGRPIPGRDALEGGEGGGLKRGGGAGWLGPPLLPGSPCGPRRRRAKTFEAQILLAPKAPKQKFGCPPQTLERKGGGVQEPPPPSSCGVRPF